MRVWQDGGPNRQRGRWADKNVVVPRLALPGLLRDVQRDLLGFLAVHLLAETIGVWWSYGVGLAFGVTWNGLLWALKQRRRKPSPA